MISAATCSKTLWLVCQSWLLPLICSAGGVTLWAGEPVQPVGFEPVGITRAWQSYGDRLTFGTGQTLALVDDGCTLSMPEWSDGDQPPIFR